MKMFGQQGRITDFYIVFVLCALAPAGRSYNWQELWLIMPIDHFSYSDNRTFSLRYLINRDSWKAGGPILFYCGNEGDIEMFANNTGFMWESAPKFRAMILFAEHRFYGKTKPFGNQSYSNLENLGKLSSEQALADYAVLLRFVRNNISGAADSPVVAVGGSYGGMLAAWFRIKYPHIVIGALASSAPILQFQGITPCWVFPAIVTRTFRNSGSGCDESIRHSWPAIRQMALNESGRNWLNNNFQLCENSKLRNAENASRLVDWLNGGWSYMAMIDYPYPTNFLNPVPAWPVKEACKFLNFVSTPIGTPKAEVLLTGIYKAISVYQNYTGTKHCFSFDDEATSSLGTTGWNFQACTEMVMPMCQNGTDMFEKQPWDFQAYSDGCASQFFGVRARQYWATTNYGGNKLRWSSNIIFSNGLLDPWSGGGLHTPIGKNLVIKIPNGGHHYDLRPDNPKDTAGVIRARRLERKMISQWLKEWRKIPEKRSKEVMSHQHATPGWNDPPRFGSETTLNPTAPGTTRNLFNRRVPFPDNVSQSSSVPVSVPSVPPTLVASGLPPKFTVQNADAHLGDSLVPDSDGTDTSDAVADSENPDDCQPEEGSLVMSSEEVIDSIRSTFNSCRNISAGARSNIERKLIKLESCLSDGCLSRNCLELLTNLVSAMRAGKFDQAYSVHSVLMLDHYSEVSQWMVGVKAVILEAKKSIM